MMAEHADENPRTGPRALVAGSVATVVTLVTLALALCAVNARAYELHGFRSQTAVVGYEADVSLQPYAEASAATWESVSGLRFRGGTEIRVVAAPLLPPIDHPGQAAQASVVQTGGMLQSCEIRVDPVEFFRIPEPARHAVLAHELGHCIGVNHSTSPGIMKNPMLYSFSEDDAEAARALYGGPRATATSHAELRYRTTAAGVTAAR